MKTLAVGDWQKPKIPGRLLLKLPFITESRFILYQGHSPGREKVEDYIYKKFHDNYDARISHFLPYLLGLKNEGRFNAAVGIRPAESGPLFLEQYLHYPIEQEIGLYFHDVIPREDIVELGNLASNWGGSSQLLFLFLTAFLSVIKREWVVFTATPEVEKVLEKMNFTLFILADADPDKLLDTRENWGYYYEYSPRVMFGHVPSTLSILKQNTFTCKTLEYFAGNLEQIIAACTFKHA